MHAVLHDASGCMKRYSNEGPDYIYVLGAHSPELSQDMLTWTNISLASSTVAS